MLGCGIQLYKKCILFHILHFLCYIMETILVSLILEKEMATHSSTRAWRIPGTEEPGGLQSMGSQSQTRLSD